MKGQALIVVFLVLALASVLAAALWTLLAVEVTTTSSQSQALKAIYIAESGMEKALRYLAGEEDWAAIPDEPEDLQEVSCGAGEFSVALSNKSSYHLTVTSRGMVGPFPWVTREIIAEVQR